MNKEIMLDFVLPIIFALSFFAYSASAQIINPDNIERPADPEVIHPAPPLAEQPFNESPIETVSADNEPSEIEGELDSFELYPNSGLMNVHQNHLACEQHYFHCNLSVFQLGQALSECMEISPNAGCAVTTSWNNGALWKPVSDNTRRPVILMPRDYSSQAELELWGAGGFIENLSFRTRANGNRPHWDVRQQCAGYHGSAPLILVTVRTTGVRECREVPDPCQRFD